MSGRNATQSEVQEVGVTNVKVYLKPSHRNAIYANGKNSLRVRVIFDLVDLQGKPLDDADGTIAASIKVELIDYSDGTELDAAWIRSESCTYPEFEVPFDPSERNLRFVEEPPAAKCKNSTRNILKEFYVGHKYGQVEDECDLGCIFSDQETSKIKLTKQRFSSRDNTLDSPPHLIALPPQAFRGNELNLETLLEHERDNAPGPDPGWKRTNSFGAYKWTAPKGLRLTFPSRGDTETIYYRIGHTPPNPTHAWMAAGACFYLPRSYSISSYDLVGSHYALVNDYSASFSVSDDSFALVIFIGEGFTWTNEGAYPSSSSGLELAVHDQYGTSYSIHVSAPGSGGLRPAVSCALKV